MSSDNQKKPPKESSEPIKLDKDYTFDEAMRKIANTPKEDVERAIEAEEKEKESKDKKEN